MFKFCDSETFGKLILEPILIKNWIIFSLSEFNLGSYLPTNTHINSLTHRQTLTQTHRNSHTVTQSHRQKQTDTIKETYTDSHKPSHTHTVTLIHRH